MCRRKNIYKMFDKMLFRDGNILEAYSCYLTAENHKLLKICYKNKVTSCILHEWWNNFHHHGTHLSIFFLHTIKLCVWAFTRQLYHVELPNFTWKFKDTSMCAPKIYIFEFFIGFYLYFLKKNLMLISRIFLQAIPLFHDNLERVLLFL